MLGSGDLDALLADSGDTITYSGTTVNGWFDAQELLEPDPSGMLVATGRKACWIRTGALTVPIEASVTINGTGYVVRDTQLVPPDGAFTKLIVT